MLWIFANFQWCNTGMGAMDGLSGCWGISIWCALGSPCDDGLCALSQDTVGTMSRILCNLLPSLQWKGRPSRCWACTYYRPTTWPNGQVCTLLQIGSNPNASHQRSLSTARACWRWMAMPESWCHRRIALAGLRCGWMDIGYVCVSISQPAPFSHSHAQEPGCHIVLLLPIPTRSYDWPVLGMEHLEKKLCKWRGSKFSERWSPYSLEVKTALQQQSCTAKSMVHSFFQNACLWPALVSDFMCIF